MRSILVAAAALLPVLSAPARAQDITTDPAGDYILQFDETVGLHPSVAEEFVTMYQASA